MTSVKPDIGFPIGRLQIELNGCVSRETYKLGRLKAWAGRDNDQPVIEYPDGTYEHVPSLSQTNWKAR